jgi:methyl-accepting chemotaxis protein
VTIDGDLVTAMLSEHGLWTYRVVQAIESGDSGASPDSVLADDQCAMGRWLSGDARAALDPPVRSEVTDRHRRLHQSAAELLTLVAEGDKERALAAVAPGGPFSLAANSLAVTFEQLRPDGRTATANPVPPKAAGDELLGTVSLVRAEAEAAATATREIVEAIHLLSDDVGEGLSTITEIAGAAGTTAHEADESRVRTEDTHHRLVGLQQSVSEISKALALIAQIARKTNIIVLNANIEAIRAGDAGRGFGVVANEVKQLADGITEATREVTGITEAVRHDTETILAEVTEFRTAIARIADNQALITQAIGHHQSTTGRMRDRLASAAGSIEVVETNTATAAHSARSAVAVGSVLAEQLRTMATATGHPTIRYQLRGAPAWFLTPDLAHLVECAPDGQSVTYYHVPSGKVAGELRPQQPTAPSGGGVFVSPAGRLVLISWDPAGAFRLWDVGTGAAAASFQDTGEPMRVAVDEEHWQLVAQTGRTAQVGRYRREVATVWDLHTGTAIEDIAVDDLAQAHTGYHPRSVADAFATGAVTAEQHLYAAATREDAGTTLVLYDGRTGRTRFRTVEPDADGVRVAFDAHGTLLLAHWESGHAGWIDVWDL